MASIFGNSSTTKAKIVRWNDTPCLIARFATSTPPLVWQLDLEKLTNYSLSITEKEGEWDLGYTVPQGAFTVVAHFDERGEAEAAYDAIQKTLLKGSPLASRSAGQPRSWFKWALLIVIAALAVLMLLPKSTDGEATGRKEGLKLGSVPAPSESYVLSAEPQKIETGVPVAADDVLPKE